MASVSVRIGKIQEPNPPLATELPGTSETFTIPSVGGVQPVVSSFYFQLYGGSENNNNQIAEDWQSAQTNTYKTAGVAFQIDSGYNIDGYVLQGVSKIQQDTGAGAYVGLCVQQGWSPGYNCAMMNGTPAQMAIESNRGTYKSDNPVYISSLGSTNTVTQAGFTVMQDCNITFNQDGLKTCWGQKFTPAATTSATSSTNPHTWRIWLWMASERADYTNGYRFFKS